jgi:hypothetical protein
MMLFHSLQQVLFGQMQLEQTYFFNKFHSLTTQEQSQCQQWMIAMLEAAQKVYQPLPLCQRGNLSDQFNNMINGVWNSIKTLPAQLKEFMEGIYDCFHCYAQVRQQELVLDLFKHPYRRGDEWFPLVIINQTLAYDPSLVSPQPMTIYRGCDQDEFNGFKIMGQCWTKDLLIARGFASNRNNPVVLEATLDNDNNVVYADSYEDLIVLKPESSLKVKEYGQAGSDKDCVVC